MTASVGSRPLEDSIISQGLRLDAHVARPAAGGRGPGLVLCHGFPAPPLGSSAAGATFPELADRIASACGWMVLTFTFRGAAASEGDFSIRGWLSDLRTAVDHLAGLDEVASVWLAGASLGGTLAICHAAGDERVRGVATLGALASLRTSAREGKGFLEHCREIGLIHDDAFPPDVDAWIREVAELDPLAAATRLGDRPLLILHGSVDDVVPVADARAFAAADPAAELRVIAQAGHRLRHDPRAVALLLGWLDRQG